MTKEDWRQLPQFPNYDINIKGDIVSDSGRVESENVLGSKAYILYRKDGRQVLKRPSELIQSAFPEVSDEEAMEHDRLMRSVDVIQKDIAEFEEYVNRRRKQLNVELTKALEDRS